MTDDGIGGRICGEEGKTFWVFNIFMRKLLLWVGFFLALKNGNLVQIRMLLFLPFSRGRDFQDKIQSKSIHVLENVSFYGPRFTPPISRVLVGHFLIRNQGSEFGFGP